MYLVLADLLTLFCLMLIIFPLLLSKFKPLNYILTMRGFGFLSNLMLPMMIMLPISFLRYYYELHQMIVLNFYQMIFYAIGTYIFVLPICYFCFLLYIAPA